MKQLTVSESSTLKTDALLVVHATKKENLVAIMFNFVIISRVIGWEGWWVFCTGQVSGCEDRLWNDRWFVQLHYDFHFAV